MKKFVRNLLSGYLLVILLLLLELAILLVFQFGAEDIISSIAGENVGGDRLKIAIVLIYLAIRLAVFIVALIIFFKIINKQEDPEFKIPWIVGMLLLPFFFSILFIIFGNHGLRKKDRAVMESSKTAFEKHYDTDERAKETLGNAAGTFSYLKSVTGLGLHTDNRVTYYKSGEEFFPELIEKLKLAKEFIFMEFFIISDGKFWNEIREILIEKAKNGVEVRLIYDDMGSGGTISSFTPQMLRRFGVSCYKFHPFRPVLSGMYNNRDHRKIVVIDHDYAYTGGMNLADEYGNVVKKFGYWKDSMIRLEGSAINNLITIFLQNYDLAQGKVSDYDKYLSHEYGKFNEEGFVMPFGDGPGGIDDALLGEQTYINILHYARREVFISTPYLVPTYELLDSLRNAALRGVKVHLIVPGIPDKPIVYKVAESNFKYLLDAGVKIYRYAIGFNHMKTILADDRLAMVGTINFDFRSLVHHFECGAVIFRSECLKDIREDFLDMLSHSEPVPKDFKQKPSAKRLCSLIKIISPLL